MKRTGQRVVRGAVLTALSVLLVVLSGSVAGAAQVPSGAAQVPSGAVTAHRAAVSTHHGTASTDCGPSSASLAPAARSQQQHRLDGPTPALPGELVGAAGASYSTARDTAPAVAPQGTTRVTRDGRAPPA